MLINPPQLSTKMQNIMQPHVSMSSDLRTNEQQMIILPNFMSGLLAVVACFICCAVNYCLYFNKVFMCSYLLIIWVIELVHVWVTKQNTTVSGVQGHGRIEQGNSSSWFKVQKCR